MEWSLILLKNAFKNISVSLKMAFEQSAHFKRYHKHYIDTYFNEVQKNSLIRIALKKGSWLATIILFFFFWSECPIRSLRGGFMMKWFQNHGPVSQFAQPSAIMNMASIEAKKRYKSRYGSLNSPERLAFMQGLPVSPSLSFPAKRGDMPFSFPALGVITGSYNGSAGHLGLLYAKRRKINVSTEENIPVVMSRSTPSCPRESSRP